MILIKQDHNICTKRNYKRNFGLNGIIKLEKAAVISLLHPNNFYNNK